jgi:excisionase family DNA binding protein
MDGNMKTENEITQTETPPGPEGFIDKPEVARRINKTVRTVDNWMARGILPYYRLGRTIAFRWSDIEAHMKANYRVAGRNLK